MGAPSYASPGTAAAAGAPAGRKLTRRLFALTFLASEHLAVCFPAYSACQRHTSRPALDKAPQ